MQLCPLTLPKSIASAVPELNVFSLKLTIQGLFYAVHLLMNIWGLYPDA